MAHDPGQKKPNANPKAEGTDNGKERKVPSSHKPHVAAVHIFYAIGGVFTLFAGILFNIHATPIPVEVGLCFVTVVFLGLGFRVWLQNNHKKKWVYNGWFIFVTVLNFAGCVMLWSLELKEKLPPGRERPEPHLTLYASTDLHPEYTVPLTNKGFIFDHQLIKMNPTRDGFLTVPITNRQTNFMVLFLLSNDSDIRIENGSIAAVVTNKAEWDNKWMLQYDAGVIPDKGFQRKVFTFQSLLPGDSIQVPFIRLPVPPPENALKSGNFANLCQPVLLMTKAWKTPLQLWGVFILPVNVSPYPPEVVEPVVLSGTNNIFLVHNGNRIFITN